MQMTHYYFSFRISVAANTARDVGGRLAAIAIWGTRASGGRYAAIAALTNILATVAAYAFYEFIFKDSNRGTFHTVIGRAFLGLSIRVVIALALTVIGKEYHDGRIAQRERLQQYHLDDVKIRYGSGSDSEKGAGAGGLEKK